MGKKKKVKSKHSPLLTKAPKATVNPNDFYSQRPAWRVAHVQMVSPFGWHEVGADTLTDIRTHLASFESMTWKEILVDSKKQNHAVKLYRLCGQAQRALENIFVTIDFDEMVSLRVGGKERVWGILEGHTLKLVWWDPDHEICPSLLSHT